jgi:serine protease Do
MRRLLAAPLLLLALTGAAPPASDSRAVDAVRRVVPSVVNISVWRDVPNTASPDQKLPGTHRERFFGSGFVIDPSGILVTNKHVVADADTITVGFEGERRFRAHVLASAVSIDIALIQIDVGHPLPMVQFGDSDALEVGQSVLAIGNPLSVGISVTSGVVSALNRDIHDTPFDDYIQTDAATNPGSSGGPLIDLDGRVVGMDTAYLTGKAGGVGSIGIAFALPASGLTFVVERLLRYGSVRAGWLGVQVQEVTPEMEVAFGLPAHPLQPAAATQTASAPANLDMLRDGAPRMGGRGLIVTSVEPGQAAAKVGIVPGDVIYAYNGDAEEDGRALLRAIGRTDVGATATLDLWHDGRLMRQPVVVQEWPPEEAPPPIKSMVTLREPSLGLSLEPIVKATDGTTSGRQGVVVTSVDNQSVAMYGGVQVGDVIATVLLQPVAKPEEVFAAFEAERRAGKKFVSMLIRRNSIPHWTTLPL